jgi:hypothetical protein
MLHFLLEFFFVSSYQQYPEQENVPIEKDEIDKRKMLLHLFYLKWRQTFCNNLLIVREYLTRKQKVLLQQSSTLHINKSRVVFARVDVDVSVTCT